MKYKTLVRIALKVMGVYFIATGLISLPYYVSAVFDESMGKLPTFRFVLSPLVANALEVLTGCYLFFGGKWVVNKIIPSNRPYCHECGYELTNNLSAQCPECGTPVPPSSVPAKV